METDNQHQQNQKKNTRLNGYARFSGIAIQMFAIIAVGTYVGVKLDEAYLKTNKLFTIILSLSSVILAIIYVVRRIISASKDSK